MFRCCTNNILETPGSPGLHMHKCCTESLFMLSTGKMACKVVSVDAHVTTDVALEWMFVAMAAHVNGVEDNIQELNITVLAFMRGLLVRCGQGRGGCARLAVAILLSKSVVLKAEALSRTATPVA